MIPRILFRTVPAATSPEAEDLWDTATAVHPDWATVTYRDPLNPADFPDTSPHWQRCTSGAQLAGLVRLEALWRHGGVYIDSDVECYRPFTPLLGVDMFAGWEDAGVVPDAVLGATKEHPAIRDCIDLAIERLRSDTDDWRTGSGAWGTGPGVTTTVLPGRDDVLLLPPGSLYPYHYSERHRRHDDHRTANPWAFCAHHWAASWLKKNRQP